MIRSVLPLVLRRSVVVVAVVGSVFLGATTVGAAASWTAASAPLSVAPESAESLASRLADEAGRASRLQADIAALKANGSELTAALDAARSRIAADAKTAAALETRLAKAKTRLAALERSLAARRTVQVTVAPRAPSTPRPPSGESEGGFEGESDG
ncbi:MAG TPA: hypothetical protein VIK65_13645 [Candidatus Limnocylindrales bacterium]|jgi:septal ring factor EnvC (AmiA/AmiB activator)